MPTIEAFRAAATSHLGYVEGPANNQTVFGAWIGAQYQPWCASFQSYVWIHDCGGTLPMGPHGSASVASFRSSYQQAKKWGSAPKAGAWVCYGHDAHIEWVDEVHADGIWTIGGNTGQGSYNNGGGVYRQFRYFAHPPEPIEGYCYPDYAPSPTQEDDMAIILDVTDGTDNWLLDGGRKIPITSTADQNAWLAAGCKVAKISREQLNKIPSA